MNLLLVAFHRRTRRPLAAPAQPHQHLPGTNDRAGCGWLALAHRFIEQDYIEGLEPLEDGVVGDKASGAASQSGGCLNGIGRSEVVPRPQPGGHIGNFKRRFRPFKVRVGGEQGVAVIHKMHARVAVGLTWGVGAGTP